MNNFTLKLMLVCLFFIASSCSNTEFLGAKKWSDRGGLYVERWFENPEYNYDTPSGTEFYGAAADAVRDRFVIKYYISDDGDNVIPIPIKDMWVNKINDKPNIVHAEDLYFYSRNIEGRFEKYRNVGFTAPMHIPIGLLLPIKSCNSQGWCQLYPTSYEGILYVRQIILDYHLERRDRGQVFDL
jgi:hypothetical protein